MNKKVSVSDYLLNKEILDVKLYIPYSKKVDIIDAILNEVCVNTNGLFSLDSVVLDRVKIQIFIETYTNLDLSLINEDDLDGYDLLIMNNELNNIINKFDTEYQELERILNLRLTDYLRDKSSLKGFFNYKLEKFIDFIDYKVSNLIDGINTLDVEKVTKSISIVLDNIIQKR
jgi:hypothetical protein